MRFEQQPDHEAQLRAIFEHLPAPLTLRDRAGRYLQLNRAVAASSTSASARASPTR